MKKTRKPTTPGEILQEEFLTPMGLTQKKISEHIGCDMKVINRIVKNKSAVSVEIAVKLGSALGTTPEFWLNAQMATDLYNIKASKLKLPKPLPKAS